MATDDEVEGGGAGWRPPRNVVKKVSGRVRVCFLPSPLLKVVRCARLAGAQRSPAARPQRGSVNVRTPEEHRRWRVRVWRHWPPAGRYLWRPRDSDSNSNDPAILQGTTLRFCKGTTLRAPVFRDCLLPRAPTYGTGSNLSSSTLRDFPRVQSSQPRPPPTYPPVAISRKAKARAPRELPDGVQSRKSASPVPRVPSLTLTPPMPAPGSTPPGLAARSAPPGLALPRPLVAPPLSLAAAPVLAPPIPDPPKPAPRLADCRAAERTSGTKMVHQSILVSILVWLCFAGTSSPSGMNRGYMRSSLSIGTPCGELERKLAGQLVSQYL